MIGLLWNTHRVIGESAESLYDGQIPWRRVVVVAGPEMHLAGPEGDGAVAVELEVVQPFLALQQTLGPLEIGIGNGSIAKAAEDRCMAAVDRLLYSCQEG